MWISTRALIVAALLCVVMCLSHFDDMGLRISTGFLLFLGVCIFWLCHPKKPDGDLFVVVLGFMLIGLWLTYDFSELGHSLMIFLLPLSGSWLAGEFSSDALPARNDRLFVATKYFLVSVLGVWSICKSFDLVSPLYLHEQSDRWFGKGDAPLSMLWLLIFLAAFWTLVGVKNIFQRLCEWVNAAK